MPVLFEGGADPMVADDYMEQVETQLASMDVTEDHLKITLATYKFTKDAKFWWKSITNQYKIEEMSWDRFKELFYEKYFPASNRWELKNQFIGLIQGNMSVTEYENKFTSLSRFAPEMVSNEVDKVRKFISGLDYKMRPLLIAHGNKVYSEAVERALMLEVEAKDNEVTREQWRQKRNCQQPGHYKSNCPLRSSSVSSAPRVYYGCGQQGHLIRDYPSQGAITTSCRGSRQRPSQSAIVQSGFRPPPPPQPAIYSQGSLLARWDTPTVSAQQSGVQISNSKAQAPQGRVFALTLTDASPGSSVLRGFIVFFTVWFNRADVCLSMLTKWLTQEPDGTIGNEGKRPVGSVRRIKDFSDVFQEISGLQPSREIDFVIDLAPGTAPIARAPYRMALVDMKELRD
ncbi:uncharacterized protein LOC132281673 [Cornus florida]|uniref:uncharacterized protein LOC132281673 n=1 Tax=Cornus florida TaxID=4283 RepID=UPI002898FF0C|nr:uncharacterized protein LOC132281673 [Cornus florida]